MPPRRNTDHNEAAAPAAAASNSNDGGRTEAMAKRAAFIQCLMYKPVMKEADARALVAEICGPDTAYESILSESNQQMAFAGLAFKTMKNPLDQQRYLGLINKEIDQPAKQLGSVMTPQQRVYFLACLEKIAQSEPGPFEFVSETELLNLEFSGPTMTASTSAAALASQMPDTQAAAAQATQSAATMPGAKLNKKGREQTLRELHEQKWLERGSSAQTRNHFTIGIRSVMELGHMLLDMELPSTMKEALKDLV